MPRLDALRTFAVALVIAYHWFAIGEGINRLPNGAIGVVMFFVISGFLSTRILINNRNRIGPPGARRWAGRTAIFSPAGAAHLPAVLLGHYVRASGAAAGIGH